MLKILIALEILLVGSPNLAGASEVELYCTKAAECEHFNWKKIHAACLEGICTCYNIHTFENTECIPNVIRANDKIGGPCCPCSFPHSECNRRELICYCEDGYMPIEGNKRCIPEEVPLGVNCEIDEQCMAANTFSHCPSSSPFCTCNDDFFRHNGTCLARTKSRTKCSQELHGLRCVLSGSNLVCPWDECVCEPGFVSLSNTTGNCIPERSYKEECKITKQCQGILGIGASCIEGICFCDKEYQVVKEIYTGKVFCKRLPVIGQYCTKHQHCHSSKATKENQLMECYHTECACRFGIKNKPPCMLPIGIGEYCTKDEHCHNGNATKENQLMECDRYKCACRFGIKYKPPCMLSIGIGEYCMEDEHCHNGNATKENQLMECYLYECACRFGIKNKPPCMLSIGIGQYCTKDEHCHSGNATKENQLMECYRTECACRFGIKNKPPCMLSMATSLVASKVTLWFMLFLLIFLIFVQRY